MHNYCHSLSLRQSANLKMFTPKCNRLAQTISFLQLDIRNIRPTENIAVNKVVICFIV